MKEVWFFGKRYVWLRVDGRIELRRWRQTDIVEVEPTEDGWRQFRRVRER
jgi:hypothetical protein